MTNPRCTLPALSLVPILMSGVLAAAEPAATTTYTEAQLASGRALYAQHCALCHGATLNGGEAGPALRGRAFTDKWAGKPAAELYELTRRTMPVTQPGGLAASQYADLVALMLQDNPQVPGPVPGTTATAALPAGNGVAARRTPNGCIIAATRAAPTTRRSRRSTAAMCRS